jgi:4a-hydroxytetrahydrobiopterin dehydratase
MKPSSTAAKISRTRARNAALINQLATPGLGSLIARRPVAGTGQLLLAVVGFTLFCAWFVQIMRLYYGEMFGNSAENHPLSFTNLFLGMGLFIAAWCWSLVTSISLVREAGQADVDALKLFSAGQVKLTEEKILPALVTVPHWQRNGEIISRTYEFKDFPTAMKFVNTVAQLAERTQHHPDIDVRWNKVTLAFTTHDAGGLTEKDFALARLCDAL